MTTDLGIVLAVVGAAALVHPEPSPAFGRLRTVGALASPSRARTGRAVRALPIVLALSLAALPAAVLGAPETVLISAPVAALCWWVSHRRLSRRRPARATLPDRLRLAASWDLLAACLRAGLPVPGAIKAVSDGLPAHAAAALGASAELLAWGASPDRAWAAALADPDTASLARGARRTAHSGTALAEVAESLAKDVRTEMGDLAEARAQRAAVLVTGPLGLCFLPAFLCLGVIPVMVGLAEQMAVPW